MKKVLKWEVGVEPGDRDITMPFGQEIVHANMQGDAFMFWTVGDPSNPPTNRIFRIFGTGHEVPFGWDYRATARHEHASGVYMWHLFERTML